MFAHKRGIGILTILFFDVVFIILWALFLGGFVNTWTAQAVDSGNFGGIESLILANLNIVIFLAVILFNIIFAVAGGRQ